MDYAPDYRYYTSDVARMWPINGVFTEDQRKLYTFIVHYNEALLSRLRPGVTPDQVMDEAAEAMEPVIDELGFTNPLHENGGAGGARVPGPPFPPDRTRGPRRRQLPGTAL